MLSTSKEFLGLDKTTEVKGVGLAKMVALRLSAKHENR
jgi:hypothetical protein